MKPDGLQNEMEECEVSPGELFAGLGLVIVESRVPQLSPKGHVEGPHVPTALGFHSGHSKHVCSNANFLCGRMEAVRRQMTVLWKNHIPMCIEVLLFPDCEHGSHQATLQDVTLPSGREPAVLLEQWTVQVLPRRGGESVARARELYQAMKSYLHFSQLSAWLNLTHGKAPRNVSYRVSPPAEFCTSSFQEVPEWHTFPVCSMSKTSIIKVTVGSLPRRTAIIHVPCLRFHPLSQQFVPTTSSGAPVVTTKASCRPQQALLQTPQEDGHRRGYQSSHMVPSDQQPSVVKHTKSPSHDQNAGYRGNTKMQWQVAGGTSSRGHSMYAQKSVAEDDHMSQVAGESRGRGRESPGLVPTHLDFTKLRSNPQQQMQQPFCDFRQFLMFPQPQGIGNSDNIPNPMDTQSIQRPPFPTYCHPHQQYPLCPPQQAYHPHQPPPTQQQPYLDPSLSAYSKRSSPAVPWMEQRPFQHQPHYQQQPPYNAFLYNHPRFYHPQTPEDMPSYHPMQHIGAISNRASPVRHHRHKSPPDTHSIRDLFPHNPPLMHHQEYADYTGHGCHLQQPDPPFQQQQHQHQQSIKAESPKVLFSKKSPGQVFYTQDDPLWVTSAVQEPSEASDGSSPEMDKFLKNVSSSIQPLSPEEIQSYLSRLSFQQSHRIRKDISPLTCKSLTEKDFVEAETTHRQTGGGEGGQQWLPSKLAKALQEANKDILLASRNTAKVDGENRTGHVIEQKVLGKSASPDDRSVTPNPSRPPCNSNDVLSELHHPNEQLCVLQDIVQPASVATTNTISSSSSPSSLSKESRLCQTKTLRPTTVPWCIKPTTWTRQTIPNLTSSNSSPPVVMDFTPPRSQPNKEATPVKTLVSQTIQKGLCRPMSPLTKQLLEDHVENGNATTKTKDSITTNNKITVSNGVTIANGKSAKGQLDLILHHSPSPKSTTDDRNHTNSCLPPEDVAYIDSITSAVKDACDEAFPFVNTVTPTLRTFKDNQNNNAKHTDTEMKSMPQAEEDKVLPAKVNLAMLVTPGDSDVAEASDTRKKAPPLLQSLLKRDLSKQIKDDDQYKLTHPVPTPQERASFRRSLDSSTNMIFHAATGLPLQSSPAPIKKRTSGCFDYDSTLLNIRAIKNSLSCANLEEPTRSQTEGDDRVQGRFYSASAPASTNCLLGNFEESLLNGRIEPSGVVEGFTAELGASGAFCPKHVVLPVTAFFFNLSDDNAPSPYLGHINLESLGRRGYHVPKKGTVQVTLFNPNKTVVKMFVVMYNLSHMPANCQTFLRQRTLYMPVSGSPSDVQGGPVFLRYLIHLRFTSSKSGKIYLHTDLRMIFARDKFEYDSSVASYELRSFTEGPINPKFSPKR